MIYRLVLAWALARGAFYWRRRAVIRKGKGGRILAWAYADGHNDDAPHLQRAINQGGVVFLPPAALLIGREVTLNDVSVVGAPTAIRWAGPA